LHHELTSTHLDAQFEISFSSYHPGGLVMTRVDGSVAFYDESVDMLVWRRLGSRRGD